MNLPQETPGSQTHTPCEEAVKLFLGAYTHSGVFVFDVPSLHATPSIPTTEKIYKIRCLSNDYIAVSETTYYVHGKRNSINIFHSGTHERVACELGGHTGYVAGLSYPIVISGDERSRIRLGSGDSDGHLRLWDVDLTFQRSPSFVELPDAPPSTFAISASGSSEILFASGDTSFDIREYDLNRPSVVAQKYLGHSKRVADVVFVSPLRSDSWRLYSVSHDKTVRLWSKGVEKCVASVAFDEDVSSAFMYEDKRTLLVGSGAGLVRAIDARMFAREMWRLKIHPTEESVHDMVPISRNEFVSIGIYCGTPGTGSLALWNLNPACIKNVSTSTSRNVGIATNCPIELSEYCSPGRVLKMEAPEDRQMEDRMLRLESQVAGLQQAVGEINRSMNRLQDSLATVISRLDRETHD